MGDEFFWKMVWANFFWFIASLTVMSIVGIIFKFYLKRKKKEEPKFKLPILTECPRCHKKLTGCFTCGQPLDEKEEG